MDYDEGEKSETVHIVDDEVESRSLPRSSAVNSLILDYYKKFGRKRDLEQYFSLSTAQSEIKDTSGIFWRRMKCQTDSSDSAEAKSESSQEVCRISIHCSVPQQSSSQEDEPKSKTESDSPPIINEDSIPEARHSDNESVKSDDNHSQRSLDVLFETSLNKIHSPSSSITSQRKLEWDSLADVGYGNESDRKTSASSLSTLERLALKQQYSNNDTNQDIGPPTAHSTPLEENDNKLKGKKSLKKTTKIFQRDVDVVEVNVPHNSELKPSQSINVNLTKHISFNVEKDGGISVDNIKRDLSVSPEKSSVEVTPQVCFDKEIQTTLTKSKEKASTSAEAPNTPQVHIQRVPILINVNTLKKRNRQRKLRAAKRALRNKKKIVVQEESKTREKHADQLSEAESFEYMPGHIYNQNQLKANQSRSSNTAGNKSSLESSGGLTTESSKDSKHSFTRDLEKGIEALSESLHKRADNSNLRKQLVKELVQKLLQSKYRDDDSTTEFLSNLSFSSKKLGLMEGHHTTSSNSDGNNTDKPKPKLTKPKKSILRGDKFNSGEIASSSQSAPNLPSATHSEKPVSSHLTRTLSSNTESDTSREKTSSDNAPNKVTSQELYKKYLEALKREDAYKRHLRDKEMFLKQKLVSSDSMIVVPPRALNKSNSRLKDLMKDLTRNNYDDGSGDASKLEGCSSSNLNVGPNSALRNQRSHSVFTLSSGQSDCQQKKPNLKKRLQTDIKHMAGSSKDRAYHYCCCPHHSNAKVGVSDSSVQVNIQNEPQKKHNIDFVKACHYQSSNEETRKSVPHVIADNVTGDLKYVCLCNNKSTLSQQEQDSFLIYKCSRLTNRGVQLDYADVEEGKLHPHINSNDPSTSKEQCMQAFPKDLIKRDSSCSISTHELRRTSKSSQTNLDIKMLCQKSSNKSITTSSSSEMKKHINVGMRRNDVPDVNRDSQNIIREGTRCVQTEISINPRISDPCLSDITIISDVDCVQLICEQYRQVSKPALEAADARSCHTQSDEEVAGASFDVIVNEPNDKYIAKLTDRHKHNAKPADRYVKQTVDKHIQSDIGEIDVGDNILENVPFIDNDNFKIPIQGTNMTLLVSLGSQEGKPQEYKNDRVVSQNIVTDKPQCADQGTSLTEECSKGVQSQCTDIFPVIDKTSDSKNKFGSSRNSSNRDTSESDKKNEGTSEFEKKNRGTLESGKKKRESFDSTKRTLPPSKSPRRVSTDVIDDDPTFGHERKTVTPSKSPRRLSTDSKHGDSDSMPEKRTTTSFKSSQEISIDFMPGDSNLTNEKKTAALKSPREIGKDVMPDDPNSVYHKKSAPFKNSRLVTTCLMHDNPKYSTYPKIDEKKLTHTHTDPGRYTENSCFVQTDNVTKKETETQLNDLIQPHSSNTKSSSIVSNQSKCDCEKTAVCHNVCQHTCSKGAIKKEGSVFESTENDLGSKRDYGVQKDLDEDSHKTAHSAEAGAGPFIKDDADQGLDRLKMKRLQRQSAIEGDKISDKSSSGDLSNKNTLVEHFQAKSVSKSSTDSIKDKLSGNDPILNMIRDITKRYSKNDVEKNKKKKCFKEIMTVLNYLLDTDDSTDLEEKAKKSDSGETLTDSCTKKRAGKKELETPQAKKLVDKGVQLSSKKYKVDSKTCTDIQFSTDIPSTSSDSATCKVLNKIKKECEKYHQKRCKSKNYDNSSSSSVHCEQCKRAHTCHCKSHKCKSHKSRSAEKVQKKCVAYNLIIQTSESMVSEEKFSEKKNRPLQNIIVKVPSKRQPENVPFKEMSAKIEKNQANSSPRSNPKMQRSKSCPNESELSSTEDFAKKTEVYTVQDYLERNRPDFVERCSNRQNCLKFISEVRANERAAQRDLLSLHVDRAQLREPTFDELRQLAQEIGCQLRRRKAAPKLISEREMKKHSEKIYKSLPEVVQKKEDLKRENIKKTNLLMASMFRKNLQKKTLRGAVNLSNYSTIIKI